MGRLTSAIRSRFLRFRKEILVVGYAVLDGRTPLRLRLAGAGLVLYLLSPLDLIPVTIPLLGLVDDLIIVPWGLSRVVSRLPEPSREAAEARAQHFIRRYVSRPLLFLVGILTVLIGLWILLLWGLRALFLAVTG